jgi:hypothetical protein
LAIEHPAHAVENERIIGCELERLLDQLLGFRQAQLAIGVRVTEGIVGLCALRLDLDQLAQAAFHDFQPAELLGQQSRLVEQVGLSRFRAQRLFQQVEGGLGLLGITQQGSFGDRELDALLRASLGCGAQFGARLIELALLGEDAGTAQLRRKVVLAGANLPIIVKGFLRALVFVGKLSKVE